MGDHGLSLELNTGSLCVIIGDGEASNGGGTGSGGGLGGLSRISVGSGGNFSNGLWSTSLSVSAKSENPFINSISEPMRKSLPRFVLITSRSRSSLSDISMSSVSILISRVRPICAIKLSGIRS